jgi:hypothetical protein
VPAAFDCDVEVVVAYLIAMATSSAVVGTMLAPAGYSAARDQRAMEEA